MSSPSTNLALAPSLPPSRSLPAELSSFPCLPLSLTTRVYNAFNRRWEGAKRALPLAGPLFTYCEEQELIGAWVVGAAAALFVLVGWGWMLPSMTPGFLRGSIGFLFTLEVFLGYACLWLFRNTDPGYLPVNEGALDPATAQLLASPAYAVASSLVPTRPFVPVLSPAEIAREARRIEEAEAAGDYSHYNDAMSGIKQNELEEEWCRRCRGWRPPRAAHCYVCQQCVLRFDHHCGLLGNCVGLRNHRFFLAFVSLLGLGGLTLVLGDLLLLAQFGAFTTLSAWALGRTWVALGLLPILAGGASFGFVAFFHCSMLLRDVTMKERYGRRRKARVVQPEEGGEFDAQSTPQTAPVTIPMPLREKLEEIWETILTSPWAFKRGNVALREKQAARRAAKGNYQPIHQQHAVSGAAVAGQEGGAAGGSVSIVVTPNAADENEEAEEQVGCTGVERHAQFAHTHTHPTARSDAPEEASKEA